VPRTDPKRTLIVPSTAANALAVLFALVAGAGTGIATAAASTTAPGIAPVSNGASQIRITLTGDNGGTCSPDYHAAKAGPVTFTVTNRTATAITEIELQDHNRILGEKENLAPGLPAVRFTLTLGGGTYQIYCPGAAQELQDFEVTGKAAAAPTGSTATILAAGTAGYASYVNGVVDAMVTAVGRLKAAIDAGNLAQARRDYPLARPFYERIESDVDGFVLPGFKITDNAGNLDYLIDMRASNLDPAVGWHGFHAIERDLFQKKAITAQTKRLAAELQTNVVMLDKLVKTLKYRPEDLANGAADLLEEVQTTKITGEEEAFSHYDLVDFAGNVEGARQAFAFLAPGLQQIDPNLTQQVNRQFAAVDKLLETYRDPGVEGGYRLYTAQLRTSDATRLSRSIQALQEPLSRIAEKVATAQQAP
jgi:iron uptake system component EfeO